MAGLSHIVTPFAETGNLSYKQTYFNSKIHTARAIIERVNGVWKLRNQCIKETIAAVKESKAKEILNVTIALHNDSILRGDLRMYKSSFDQMSLDHNVIIQRLPDEMNLDDPIISQRAFVYDYVTRNMQ